MLKRLLLALIVGILPISLITNAPFGSSKEMPTIGTQQQTLTDGNDLESLTHSELVKIAEALDLSSTNTPVDMGENYKIFDNYSEDFQNAFLTSAYTIPAESSSIIGDSAASIASSYEDKYGLGGSLNINVPVGSVNFGVSSSFDTGIKSSFQSVNEEYYEYWQVSKTMKIAQIDWKAINVEGFLNSEFKNALNNVNSIDSAKDLLKKYGTHLFDNYYFGGLMSISRYICSSTSIAEDLASESFEFNLTADIASAIESNINGNQSTQLTNVTNTATTQTTTKVIAKGGNDLNGLTPAELFTFKQEYASEYETGFVYQAWLKSIGLCESLRVVNVSKPIPIWEVLSNTSLCDTAKKDLLKEAFNILCFENYSKNCLKLETAPGYIDSIAYVANDYQIEFNLTSSSIKLPQSSVANLHFGDILVNSFNSENISLSIVSGNDYCTLNNNVLTIKDGTLGKKISLEIKVFSYVMFTLDINVARDSFEKGYGSKSQPYLISTSAEFTQLLNNKDNYSKTYFELIDDIDLGGKSFSPGGSASKSIFYGSINGNYHKISNFTIISKGEWNNIGLIGNNCGHISNLIIDNAKVINSGINAANSKGLINAGILVGRNSGSINQVSIRNSSIRIAASLEDECLLNVGGLVGFNDKHSYIKSCSVNNSFIYGISYDSKGEVNTGGLVGRALNSTISNSLVSNTNVYVEAFYNNYGEDGNYYVKTNSSELYKKEAGKWKSLGKVTIASEEPKNASDKYYYNSSSNELYEKKDKKWNKIEAFVLEGIDNPKNDVQQQCIYSVGGLLGKAETNSKISFVVLFWVTFNQKAGQFGNVAGISDKTSSFENTYYESISTAAVNGQSADGCTGVRILTLETINNTEWDELWTSDSSSHPVLRWEVR